MTNYNDGNWHGWNGGRCPVDPRTVVHVIYTDDKEGVFETPMTEASYIWDWDDKHEPIVAFRVVKEYKEPREYWVDTTSLLAFNSKQNDNCIKVREVT